ncbi:DEAD protein [Rhizoctonia solani]|uniref:ATP-dependent RNA helicase n=1 Tax=Rhizoctonia solani TaxID=456999 RepID=A0A8H7LZD2_9AGAM|nr:DEAD protein [Rhizoctonia solani]
MIAYFERHQEGQVHMRTVAKPSSFTSSGLKKAFYTNMTDIQAKSLPMSLKGRDVLGAARTGSGKTLSFLIPVLEILHRINGDPGWIRSLSDITYPRVVLDEADRILDMGFSKSLNAIVGHLPKGRQTLLFSATQTDSVQQLARLSLRDPVYIGVTEDGAEGSGVTPKNLEQHYAICPLDRKLDALFGFIKTHLQSKALVFMSSCKQVRFVFETFCKLHPGIPLMHLHGKQKQTKRLDIFQKFASSKHAFLFATDVAARGLDFPAVDWVLQLDAPEDTDTYVHRVGRTARYERKGQSLLFLCPSEEEGMVTALKAKGIAIQPIKIKESKLASLENSLQKFAFEDPDIKYLAQRAFISYVKSVYLQKDKSIFQLINCLWTSMQLHLAFRAHQKLNSSTKRWPKNGRTNLDKLNLRLPSRCRRNQYRIRVRVRDEDQRDDDPPVGRSAETLPNKAQDGKAVPIVRTKYDRMFERKNQGILSEHYAKLVNQEDNDADQDDDFITLKRANHDLPDDESRPTQQSTLLNKVDHEDISQRKLKIGQSKRAMLKYKSGGTKLVFDDDGEPIPLRTRMRDEDVLDKQEAREKKKEKKRKRKDREQEAGGGDATVLGPGADDDDGYISPDFDDLLSDGDEDDSPVYRPNKKIKGRANVPKENEPRDIDDDEALALRMLRGEA